MSAVSLTSEAALQGATERSQLEPYGLVIFNTLGTSVLVTDGRLPAISIPQFTRPAEQITATIGQHWQLQTVLLSSRTADVRGDGYAVLEALEENWVPGPDMKWCDVKEVDRELAPAEASQVRSSHARAIQPYSALDSEPFARLGWAQRIRAWAAFEAGKRGISLAGMSQWNGSETFALIRFQGRPRSVWFKAVGSPNRHEFPITLTLAQLFPGYVPPVLSSDSAVNGWLMEEIGQKTLAATEDLEMWTLCVERLAALQASSVPLISQLLDIGCRDLRVPALAKMVVPFMEATGDLMRQQKKISPAPLTPAELFALREYLTQALDALGQTGLPDTLGHTDFNPGNVLLEGKTCAFTDWAEAHVACPFLTVQYLLAHMDRMRMPRTMQRALLERHIMSWQSLSSRADLRRASRFASLVAVFAYGVSLESWRNTPQPPDESGAAYLRSLARRMKKEADLLRESDLL